MMATDLDLPIVYEVNGSVKKPLLPCCVVSVSVTLL